MIKTRFAPSPTGKLHIGGARTALFNYLFSKFNNGHFYLRIEDTDIKRSTSENIDVIINSLDWLKLKPSMTECYQSKNISNHIDIAYELFNKNFAYKCFLEVDELEELRSKSRKEGKVFKSPYRDQKSNELKKDFVLRLKMPLDGKTIINDGVQGNVSVENSLLDDMVLLRKDQTPTYMLASVVDDYNMQISHIIRGDDHFNNAFRQIQIIKYLNWPIPNYIHIPLIHGNDGTKLSKRNGSMDVLEYKKIGFEPIVLNNYLLRLGYSVEDDNIYNFFDNDFPFKIDKINKSPARFDFKKLANMNSSHLKNQPIKSLVEHLSQKFNIYENEIIQRLTLLLPELIKRYTTINELKCDLAWINNDFKYEFKLEYKNFTNMCDILSILKTCDWNINNIKNVIDHYLKSKNLMMKDLGPLLRIKLTGKSDAPNIFVIIFALGRNECIKRLTYNY